MNKKTIFSFFLGVAVAFLISFFWIVQLAKEYEKTITAFEMAEHTQVISHLSKMLSAKEKPLEQYINEYICSRIELLEELLADRSSFNIDIFEIAVSQSVENYSIRLKEQIEDCDKH